jgi:hypothetical protein
VTRPSEALSQPAPTIEGKRPDARKGRKAIAFWVDPGVSMQVRMLGLRSGRTVQDLMEEAVEDLFRKHGLPSLSRAEAA